MGDITKSIRPEPKPHGRATLADPNTAWPRFTRACAMKKRNFIWNRENIDVLRQRRNRPCLRFITRRNPTGPLIYDSDIEGTIRRNRREIRQSLNYIEEEQVVDTNTTEEMVENNPLPPEAAEHHAPRTMYDYAKPNLTGIESSIIRPAIAANNFELKPNTIQMIQQFVQFDSLQDEDPNNHLANFLEFCDTFKINGVFDDVIRLRLFPFSLRNKAKQ
ncbi:RING-H2 finger protein ATL63 [Gossypium australe]|uniref:RING-H2 finger protein ATL63 n=1 Tax=Gossypium australe TaxID=47621 RepID=A0A5B6V9W9_9ROSI|nr:RING-H2 finger protein ATL63 [Gossypium australe]